MSKIKVGIIGVGNCASSLVQGIYYYNNLSENDSLVNGLIHKEICGYKPTDIQVVLAFDIDSRKVGKDVSEAIFMKPNCTKVFCADIPFQNVQVMMGKILDGVSEHMGNYQDEYTFVLSNQKEPTKDEVVEMIKNSGAEVLINYLPVGSEKATQFYVECALDANVGFVNCMPVFIASNKMWEEKFREKNLPKVGDDIKAQVGATIVHRTLANLFMKRGVRLTQTYQINTGGNTDFLNMLNRNRLTSKKISKTEAVQSVITEKLSDEYIHIGPSDYVPWQKDNKVCFMRLEGKLFGDVEMNLELRLSVEDSPNSAGVVIDAIRCCKIALDRKIGGALIGPSSYFMKHPPMQYEDDAARNLTELFINEIIE